MFEVRARATSTVEPMPIKAMGRFVHEACPVDPKTGIVYQTEDNGDPGDGFYRYLPDHKGKLHRGGKLQMLAIKGRPKYNTATDQTVGEKLECAWVDIKDPDPNGADHFPQAVYMQGRKKGGAQVHRPRGRDVLEGQLLLHAPPTAATQARARSGATRPTTRTSSAERSSWCTSRRSNKVLRARRDHGEPARRRPRSARTAASEDVNGEPSRISYLDPNGKLHNFAEVTEKMQLHDHIGADLFPYNPDRFDNPPERGQGVGRSEAPGSASAPTASGCSSTSSIRARRSRSPGPGARVGSERLRDR